MPFSPQDWLKRIEHAIWAPSLAGLPAGKKYTVRAVRLMIVLVRDLTQGKLSLWTMSLVYTTLLSMVPLLALSFSVLKAFGVHDQVEPFLEGLLAPLGAQGHEISSRLTGFIERMNVGVLGAVGLATLIYTVISLMQKIEEAFNAIWHVTHLRSLGERFSRYLSALLVGPLLIFAALGMTATALNSEVAQTVLAVGPLDNLAVVLGRLLPYALVIAAFAFFYMFVPNARVRWMPALVAALVGGVLWQSAGWAFAAFVASSTRYSAIYSSFAVMLLFLIWLYVSWLVLLIGASVAFYLQHPEYLYAEPGEPRLSNRMRERLALAIMYLIGLHFIRGRPPWTLQQLAQRLCIPMYSVSVVVDSLEEGGLVKLSNDEPPSYLPLRDLSQVSVAQVLATVRKAGESDFLNPGSLPVAESVEAIVAATERAIASSAGQISVRDMAEEGDAAAPVRP